ncbi:MAG: RidA family protein [Planctomycetota bacterium]
MTPEQKFNSLGLILPSAPKAVGVYKPAVTVGNLCYTSGHLPVLPDGELMKGCVGKNVDQQAGYDAAKQAGLNLLATLKDHLGSLDRVKRVVKLLGMVYSSDQFVQHPAVINGCSELFVEVYGEQNGAGTRSAFGVAALPLGVTVEIEGIFELVD